MIPGHDSACIATSLLALWRALRQLKSPSRQFLPAWQVPIAALLPIICRTAHWPRIEQLSNLARTSLNPTLCGQQTEY